VMADSTMFKQSVVDRVQGEVVHPQPLLYVDDDDSCGPTLGDVAM